jgi:hypothetical protein
VFFATLGYLLLLGPAVGDAPVFTLPMLLPWALWVAAGAAAIHSWCDRRPTTDERRTTTDERRTTNDRKQRTLGLERWSVVGGRWSPVLGRWSFVIGHWSFVALLALTLAWGATRYRVSSKRHLWLYRAFAEATLSELPPGAAVLAHWEQGMTLQYLRLVEGRRPDVWVDVVEPSDDPWGARAGRRYPTRPVFFVGPPESVAGLPVELVREDEYASLFRLRR